MVKVKKDLTGQKFGRLTVIRQAEDYVNPNTGVHSAKWECQCECGNECNVSGKNLRDGSTKSCGCIKHQEQAIDISGQKFGRLTVIEKVNNRFEGSLAKPRAYWRCICSCGNEVIVSGKSLRSGNTKSCGCLSREVAQKQAAKNFKKYNSFEICGDYVTMYTLKNEPFYVDLEDFDKVKDICWWRREDGYILGRISGTTVRLHRFIMNCPDGYDVDHIHGKDSKNDNRKSNLRIATRSQNNMNKGLQSNNTSGVTGVSWDNYYQKWIAQIKINNKNIRLGMYKDKESAINARKKAEEKYFGEWSYDNSQKNKSDLRERDV